VNDRLWSLAQGLVLAADSSKGRRRCAELNQALMELGALLCRPARPMCLQCPWRDRCLAHRTGRVDRLPNLGSRTPATPKQFAAFVACWDGHVLVRQRPESGINGRLWEFPNLEIDCGSDEAPAAIARRCLGAAVRGLAPLCTIRHSITRYRIRLDAYQVRFAQAGSPPRMAGVWLKNLQLDEAPFASAHKKVLAAWRRTNTNSTADELSDGSCSRDRKTRNRLPRERGPVRTSW
jgi:A/G-specific adenine glycosylase